MFVTERQIYKCQNRDCRCEVEIIRTPTDPKSNPKCGCGSEMKKPYHRPVFRELSAEDFRAILAAE